MGGGTGSPGRQRDPDLRQLGRRPGPEDFQHPAGAAGRQHRHRQFTHVVHLYGTCDNRHGRRSDKVPKDVTLVNHARPAPEPRVRQVRVSGRHLLVSLSLPPLSSGSTASLVTTFLSTSKAVEHKTATTLTHLGHASSRLLEVRIPAGVPAGTTAWVTLVAITASGSQVTTSSAHVTV